MSHETGQLENIDRQLMETGATPKPSEWTEIGEAEIVYTIFGKAKVRIIRKNDKMRHWIILLVTLVIVVVAWQGWVIFERTEPIQSTDYFGSKGAKLNLAPALPSATISESNNAQSVSTQKSESQQSIGLKDANQTTAKPLVHQPLKDFRSQSAPVATNNPSIMNQPDKHLSPPQLSKQIVLPTAPLPHTTQSAASSPAAISLPVAPIIKADTTISTPASDNQQIEPAILKH